eukprot:CFRG6894T1
MTIENITTVDGWRRRQSYVLEQLEEVLGPFPEKKSDLNPKITGTLVWDDGNTVVEKIVFESRPGFYVTGALFLPLEAHNLYRKLKKEDGLHNEKQKKWPVLINPAGHTPLSFRADGTTVPGTNYQGLILNFVRKGYIVFAYDPPGQGERSQYFDPNTFSSAAGGCLYHPPTGKKLGESCTMEHNRAGRALLANGINPSSFWLWDGIRAVDYVLSRSEIDADRVGVYGCSGGGTQTAYIAALDPRIRACSIGCYMTTAAMQLSFSGPQDAEQLWWKGAHKKLDKPDLLVARAHKATHVLANALDNVFSIQGARDAVFEATPAYLALGGRLSFDQDTYWHGYGRGGKEAMYRFFGEELLEQTEEDIDDTHENIQCMDAKSLTVTEHGQIALDLPQNKNLFQFILEYTSNNMKMIKHRRKLREAHFTRVVKKAKLLSGYTRPTFHPRQAVSTGFYFGMKGNREDLSVRYEQFMIESENPCMLVVELYIPATSATPTTHHTDSDPKYNHNHHGNDNENTDKDSSYEQTKERKKERPVYPTIVYTSSTLSNPSQDAEDIHENGLLKQALARGQAVAVVSVCGFDKAGYSFAGEVNSADFRSGKPASLALMGGRSIVGLHAADIMRAFLFLSTHASVEHIVGIVCKHHVCPAAIHLAAIENWAVPQLVTLEAPLGYRSMTKAALFATPYYMDIPGVLLEYDLADLLASLRPKPLMILGALNSHHHPISVDESRLRHEFQFVNRTYIAAVESNDKSTFKMTSLLCPSGVEEREMQEKSTARDSKMKREKLKAMEDTILGTSSGYNAPFTLTECAIFAANNILDFLLDADRMHEPSETEATSETRSETELKGNGLRPGFPSPDQSIRVETSTIGQLLSLVREAERGAVAGTVSQVRGEQSVVTHVHAQGNMRIDALQVPLKPYPGYVIKVVEPSAQHKSQTQGHPPRYTIEQKQILPLAKENSNDGRKDEAQASLQSELQVGEGWSDGKQSAEEYRYTIVRENFELRDSLKVSQSETNAYVAFAFGCTLVVAVVFMGYRLSHGGGTLALRRRRSSAIVNSNV